MPSIYAAFFADPVYYVGALLAFFAAIGFVIFLAGVGGGTPNMFHMHGNDEHLEHARARALWGIYIMATTFALWEVLRWCAALFAGTTLPNTGLVIAIVAAAAAAWVWKALSGPGGH